jgi:hypothetical protein
MNSQEKKHSAGEADAGGETPPPIGHPVWVKCGDYRTLAYRDEKGTWRTVAKREEVKMTKVLG